MRRSRLSLAFAALLALALLAAGCGGDDESPRALVEDATLAGIESADLDLSLAVAGGRNTDVRAEVAGPFEESGDGAPPRMDIDAEVSGKARGKDVDFRGGIVLLPNTAFVGYRGVDYEVDPTTYGFVESTLRRSQRRGGGSPSACREAIAELSVADFAREFSDEGKVDVGGTETTKLSGDLDVGVALDALTEVGEEPACRSQLGSVPQVPSPERLARAKERVADAVRRAHVDLYVGEDDIIRRIDAALEVAPKGRGKGRERLRIDLDLTLTGVNEEQEIAVPQDARPLSELFLKTKVNPLELAGALQREGLGGVLKGLDGDISGLGGLGALGGGGGGGGPGA